ncbi:MAG: hypothetical protein HUK22_06490 [Thermoguttaceae bacterium]|nr:hypothetical protein [Thermoguttaceae bacterium]
MLPTTWFYLSSLLLLAVFFRFNRAISLRNFDVLTLISLTPGLAYIAMGSARQGYAYLAIIGAVLFARLFLDLWLTRRPILEPNLNSLGLVFACVVSTFFMIPNLFLNSGDACRSPRAWRLEQILAMNADERGAEARLGDYPGYLPFARATLEADRFFAPSADAWRRALAERRAELGPGGEVDFFGAKIKRGERRSLKAVELASGRSGANDFLTQSDEERAEAEPLLAAERGELFDYSARASDEFARSNIPNLAQTRQAAAPAEAERSAFPQLTFPGAGLIWLVVALQAGVVAAIILIGKRHFGSWETGCAAATFYLLHPYVNQFSGCLDHIVPALAILTAVLFYRRPVVAGGMIALAGSLVFYPFFLVPIWAAFYFRKGLAQFLLGVSVVVLTLAVALLFIPGVDDFPHALAAMFGRHSIFLASQNIPDGAEGAWEYFQREYRIPLITLQGAFCVLLTIWPSQKNLATLVASSAMTTLGVQFWMGYRGGLYMAWFLPLAVLVVFRPNLSDRTATNVVIDARRDERKSPTPANQS